MNKFLKLTHERLDDTLASARTLPSLLSGSPAIRFLESHSIMQGRARREGKEGEGGRSEEEMAFTDYSEQRNVGQDSMHHARFAVAPLSYLTCNGCCRNSKSNHLDMLIKLSQMKQSKGLPFFVSTGDWLTSSPPLFPSVGGGVMGGMGQPTSGATMATAGCSKGHCECAPGVGGALCDRCLKDFWGFSLIGSGAAGALGCTRKHASSRGHTYLTFILGRGYTSNSDVHIKGGCANKYGQSAANGIQIPNKSSSFM